VAVWEYAMTGIAKAMSYDVAEWRSPAVSLDLVEASLEDAINLLNQEITELVVSPADAVAAGRLAKGHSFRVVVSPALKRYAWMLVGTSRQVVSAGAGEACLTS
jgi:hypothetical protein